MEETERLSRQGLPIRTLSLEVVGGPDQGKKLVARSERVTVGTAEDCDLRLSDTTVSRYHLELSCLGGRVLVADMGSTNGITVSGITLERGWVGAGTVLQLGASRVKVVEGQLASLELSAAERFGPLLGRTPRMRHLFARAHKAAQSEVAVLVRGESGTGKELVALALHAEGPRAAQPFVTVDCGALSPNLVASELFGHERGAFTGAERRTAGAFERAGKGTVFLDEIGELPSALQATLLGVLERKRFRRVGGADELPMEARVVSATHRDLRAEVNKGTFRLDLYYRLAVVNLEVPPLRERPDDLPLLIEHFEKEAGHTGSLFDAETMRTLSAHQWPGNVRELRNFVEASMALGEVAGLESRGDATAAPVPLDVPAGARELVPYKQARAEVLDAFEARYVKALLERTENNVSLGARLAQMDRSYLSELVTKHKKR